MVPNFKPGPGLFRGMAIYSLLSNANNLFTVYHLILYALVHRPGLILCSWPIEAFSVIELLHCFVCFHLSIFIRQHTKEDLILSKNLTFLLNETDWDAPHLFIMYCCWTKGKESREDISHKTKSEPIQIQLLGNARFKYQYHIITYIYKKKQDI